MYKKEQILQEEKSTILQAEIYETPTIEIIEMELEQPILSASSTPPDFTGENW